MVRPHSRLDGPSVRAASAHGPLPERQVASFFIYSHCMKPVISLLLQLSPQTAYGNLEAVARNLSDGLEVLLNSRKVKCSIFMDGPTLEMLKKVAKPLAMGKIKSGVEEGLVEFLGGGFYDPMLPLFPKDLQTLQLKKHRSKLKSFFEVEPQGYFNSSLVWEMGMISVLEEACFDYALVSEAAVREALGRNSPVSGWFTVEDQGSLMRVVPVSEELSRAISEDDLKWRDIAAAYSRDDKPVVALLDLPPEASEIVGFFERLVDFVETNEVQSWPVGYIVNQLQPEGSLSYLISAGRKLGLPSAANTCREMLIRRPEINLLQKNLLNLFKRGKGNLQGKNLDRFYEKLMPAMSPIFYRNLLGDEGMQCLKVRQWGYRYLLNAATELDSLMNFTGLRMDVNDALLRGHKQIWVENTEVSCLVDFNRGGSLRLLNGKGSAVNFVNTWRDDGTAPLFLAEGLLPNSDMNPQQVESKLAGRDCLFLEHYDYQVKRGNQTAQIQLIGEQGFRMDNRPGLFHICKTMDFDNSSSKVRVTYEVTNSSTLGSECFFGSLLELGILNLADGNNLVVDGASVTWDRRSPLIHPGAKKFKVRDFALDAAIELQFDEPTPVFVGPVFGASSSAAPEVFQGIRLFPFWKATLEMGEKQEFKMTITLSKR